MIERIRRNELQRLIPYAIAAISALAPIVLCRASILQIFWFGDEWDLLDRCDRRGVLPWTFEFFAENFVPLFKTFWIGSIWLVNGSYAGMLIILWLTHAIVCVQATNVLLKSGLGSWSACAAVIMFSTSAAHIETLGWSVQWSAVLAVVFLLLPMQLLLSQGESVRGGIRCARVWVLLAITASALCFSRGILTGLALIPLMFRNSEAEEGRFARAVDVLVCVAPGILVGSFIFLSASGNHTRQHGVHEAIAMLSFGCRFFVANPILRFLDLPDTSSAIWLAGIVKVTVISFGWRHAPRPARVVLVAFLLYDFVNSALIAFGRHHTGIDAAVSYRYQYCSQLCLLPFVASLLNAIWRCGFGGWIRVPICVVLIMAGTFVGARQWPSHARWFAGWRGSPSRILMLQDGDGRSGASVPGVPWIPVSRGDQIVARFNLH